MVPVVDDVQTISSLRLAQTLSAKAVEAGCQIECLIQVNLAEEDSKSGVSPEDLSDLVSAVHGLPGIRVQGLMCIPPRSGLSDARRWFRLLRQWRDRVQTDRVPLPELSMGMSGDFDGAIMEGATIIRGGHSSLGPRPNR